MIEELMKAKKILQKKLPTFRRVEKHRHPRLPDNWRKPKGHHSKIRRAMKWEMRVPKIGMKTPVKVQNFDKHGRELIMVRVVSDLKKLTDKTVGILASGLGLKKKSLIAKEAVGKKYKFLNFNPEKVMEKVKNKLSAKKEKPKVAEQKVEVSVKQAEKPAKPVKEEKPNKPKKAAMGEK